MPEKVVRGLADRCEPPTWTEAHGLTIVSEDGIVTGAGRREWGEAMTITTDVEALSWTMEHMQVWRSVTSIGMVTTCETSVRWTCRN